jgi:hypothetical protein
VTASGVDGRWREWAPSELGVPLWDWVTTAQNSQSLEASREVLLSDTHPSWSWVLPGLK